MDSQNYYDVTPSQALSLERLLTKTARAREFNATEQTLARTMAGGKGCVLDSVDISAVYQILMENLDQLDAPANELLTSLEGIGPEF